MTLGAFRYVAATTLLAACVLCIASAAQNQGSAPAASKVPAWANPVSPPPPPGFVRQPDFTPKHVPGSTVTYTVDQIRDDFSVPDWYPNDHPSMPDPVGHGRRPSVRACGFCHLPNGQGRPENSSLVGLPAAYIARQISDIKSGARRSTRMGPMLLVAQNITDEELQNASQYFASMKPKRWIRVVEADTVPKTRIFANMLVPAEESGTEQIGQRIIETVEDLDRTEVRDSASGFVAYVPVGSVKKGEALVKTGGEGKMIRCSICHGQDLKGLGYVPSLAGRSPSYLARQLYDMQSGARNGAWTPLMKEVVAKLTPEDIVAITAYTASLAP